MAYSAGDTLVRAVMTSFTGLPEDTIVNDFAFKAAGIPSSGDLDDMFNAVDGFYRDAQTSTDSVGEYISDYVDRSSTHLLQAYTITAGGIGSPIREDAWLGPTTANTVNGVPSEVAAVLSFHADLTGVPEESGATRPKARRRGRVYVGPLTTTAILTTAAPYLLNSAQFLTTLRQAAVAMMDEADTAGVPWCVWSRVDQVLRPVVGGWTDNAPDTQRRRGPASNSRVVWS